MAELHKDREQKKARGDHKGLAESYTQEEIQEVYNKAKGRKR